MKLLYASLAALLLVVLLDGTTAGRGGPGSPGGHHRGGKFCEVSNQTCPSCPNFMTCEDATPEEAGCDFTEAVVKICEPIECSENDDCPTQACNPDHFCGPQACGADDSCPAGHTCGETAGETAGETVCKPDRPTETCQPVNCS